MPVTSVHPQYTAMQPAWTRCRDAAAGSDAVKAKGTRYLPLLEGQAVGVSGWPNAYTAYKDRALYYPVTGRTVMGLTGLVFGKPPTVSNVDPAQRPEFADVTLIGTPLEAYAIDVCEAVLVTGRAGTLIDFPEDAASGARPYWVRYDAEAITNWRTTRIGGRQVLTLLVLKETVDVENPDDPFQTMPAQQYRVCELVDDVYQVTIYAEDPDAKGTYVASDPRVPLRRGVALPFIPFVFHGPANLTAAVDEPPLLALVDVNLSHYRTSADREHGAHWTALPTPYVSGHTLAPGETLTIGSGNAWVLPDANARAGMVEFSGAGLAALKDLMEEKRLLMISLGSRMLETQKNVQEAAQTVRLRHAGEASALAILAATLGTALTQALQWHLWWSGVDEAVATAATITMNPELLEELTSEDVKTLVTTWQAGAISKKTVYANLEWGEWTRPGVTFEEEEAEIAREGGTGTLDLPDGAAGAAA